MDSYVRASSVIKVSVLELRSRRLNLAMKKEIQWITWKIFKCLSFNLLSSFQNLHCIPTYNSAVVMEVRKMFGFWKESRNGWNNSKGLALWWAPQELLQYNQTYLVTFKKKACHSFTITSKQTPTDRMCLHKMYWLGWGTCWWCKQRGLPSKVGADYIKGGIKKCSSQIIHFQKVFRLPNPCVAEHKTVRL